MDQHAAQSLDSVKKDAQNGALHPNTSLHSPSMDTDGKAIPGLGTAGDVQKSGLKPAPFLTNGSNGPQHGAAKDAPVQSQDRLPPELEHWTHTYVPMGKLLERVAQQCYNDLIDTVDGMAELSVASPGVNGAGSHAGPMATPDTSDASIQKKLRLMNFAQEQKDRFIKTLVLSDWARNIDDMSKLIELRMWLQQQDEASSAVADALIRLKHNMIPAKMPNPNIQGALELLSTGQASWMPDLGYIPPKPLTPEALLKTLKDMNFALSVRLSLHEDLPSRFSNYTIANGRATFTVPNEFEVDLAVADEDPDSPFYFIDMRLLLSSSQPIPDGAVRASLEFRVNAILASEGLKGCYAFLHDFALTHSINTLRRQGLEMESTKWSGHMKLEAIHRDFVVQYWTEQPGGTNWIHVGTLSGSDTRDSAFRKDRNPQLGLRWIREGQEVSDVGSNLNQQPLSMETILEQIIANHVRWRLGAIKDNLMAMTRGQLTFSVDLKSNPADECACSLEVRFGRCSAPLTLRISPVTGRFSISPVTPITMDVENRLNSDLTLDPGHTIAMLCCKLLQTQISKQAKRVGWFSAPLERLDNPKKYFGNEMLRWSIFASNVWSSNWAIAVTISLSGERWWVVETEDRGSLRSIKSAEALSLTATSKHLNRASLLDIEAKAIVHLSFSNITKDLRRKGIQYELKQAQTVRQAQQSPEIHPKTMVLCINFRDLMQPKDRESSKTWRPWCQDVLMLTHHGASEASGNGEWKSTHILKAVLTKETASILSENVQPHREKDVEVDFSKSGACALLLRTNYGRGLVDLIESNLRRVERLSNHVLIARKAQMQHTHASISRLVLKYDDGKPLFVETWFTDQANAAVQIKFGTEEESGTNPHRRIQPLLQKFLDADASKQAGHRGSAEEYRRFAFLLHILKLTLPLLRGFESLETADSSMVSVRGIAHAFGHYRLAYSEALPSVVFDILLYRKDGREGWMVRIPRNRKTRNGELEQRLRSVWSCMGDGWSGLTGGATAEINGIEDLLSRLDASVREGAVKPEDNVEEDPKVKKEVKMEIVVLD